MLLYHRRPPVRATLSCEGRCEVKQRCGPPVRATPLVREAALLQHHRPPVRATLSYEGVVLPSGSLLNVTGPLLTFLRSSSMGFPGFQRALGGSLFLVAFALLPSVVSGLATSPVGWRLVRRAAVAAPQPAGAPRAHTTYRSSLHTSSSPTKLLPNQIYAELVLVSVGRTRCTSPPRFSNGARAA